MNDQLYLVQDTVSGAFGAPFFARSDEQVRRDFSNMVSAGSVPDYVIRDSTILCFGVFHEDKVNPRFDLYDVPRVVLRGGDVLNAQAD